jgi:hypothetical protein
MGFAWRTASAEAKQSKACPRGIEVNTANAASNKRKHSEMDAGPRRRSKSLASRDRQNIFIQANAILAFRIWTRR